MKEENLAIFVGNRLRTRRVALGLRQQDMEDRGINYKYYQRVEAGKVNLTLRSLEKLASALDVKVLGLFQRPALKKEIMRKKSKRV